MSALYPALMNVYAFSVANVNIFTRGQIYPLIIILLKLKYFNSVSRSIERDETRSILLLFEKRSIENRSEPNNAMHRASNSAFVRGDD